MTFWTLTKYYLFVIMETHVTKEAKMVTTALSDKKIIINTAVLMVKKDGWEAVNARSLAKALGMSTKPLYRIYSGMDEIKKDLYDAIFKIYDEYITKRIDHKNALITLCVAYIEFAKENKNLFKCLFLSHNLNWKTIDNVLDEKWNQSTIVNLVNKYNYTFDEAKNLFLNIWIYANGLATLLATNDLTLESKDIIRRIVQFYKKLVAEPNKSVSKY